MLTCAIPMTPHVGWGDPFGFHYYSDDGGYTWGGNNNQKVYENVVELVGGGSKILSRRERPHVVGLFCI